MSKIKATTLSVLGTAWVIVVVGAGLIGGVADNTARDRPLQPSPPYTAPWKVKGVVHYLTPAEAEWAGTAQAVFILGIIGVFAVGLAGDALKRLLPPRAD